MMANVQLRNPTQGLLTPARPAHAPWPALRKSHFPDPPTCRLRRQLPPARTLHCGVPDALSQRRAAAALKRSLLGGGEDRSTIERREYGALDAKGSHQSESRSANESREHGSYMTLNGPDDRNQWAADNMSLNYDWEAGGLTVTMGLANMVRLANMVNGTR